MNADYVYPEQVDNCLNWRLGTAARLARRMKLPHYVLPNGDIRFRLDEVQALVKHVLPVAQRQEVAHAS